MAVFLSMNGNAQNAIDFYKNHLNAEQLMKVTYSDMVKIGDKSIELNDKNKNHINYSVLKIGKTKIMIAENTMDTNEKYKVGNNFSICIQSADLEEIQQFYNSLISDEKVKIIIPLASNIFSKAYGIVEDPFGVQIQLMFDDILK
ncbi:VOC family protein [Paraclostridium dentum]|uniref:VOC family protein n=1 Tax=Paraclostridium dentum TaxID=2662455 RepID=UPI003F2F743B